MTTSVTLPKIMRAWTHRQRGSPLAVLTLTEDVPTPSLTTPTSVLVRVTHASLSPGSSIMTALLPTFFRGKPCIPELDFSGFIVDLGSAVPESRELKKGDQVFGSIPVGTHLSSSGALAEYVVVEAKNVVPMPKGCSAGEAAGLGVSGCTALTLLDKSGVKSGDRVLVNGASGGVGTLALQMVKDAVGKDGKVVAVCSGRNIEVVKSIGADEVIDYEAHTPVHEYLGARYGFAPFDHVIEAYGVQDIWLNCDKYLKPEGRFTSVGVAFASYTASSVLYGMALMMKNMISRRWLSGVNREYVGITGIATLEGLERLRKLVEEEKLKCIVGECFVMEDALKAYEIMLKKRARGKLIIRVQD